MGFFAQTAKKSALALESLMDRPRLAVHPCAVGDLTGKPVNLWTSPSDLAGPFGPCGQADGQCFALTTACPHSRPSRPQSTGSSNEDCISYFRPITVLTKGSTSLDGKALFGMEIEQRLQTRKRLQVKREGTDRESGRSCRRTNGRQRTEQRPKGSRDKGTLCFCFFFRCTPSEEAQYRIPADNSPKKSGTYPPERAQS